VATHTYAEIEALVLQLSSQDRQRLIEAILTHPIEPAIEKTLKWQDVRGIAPNLLGGEDAQEWVSRTRRESDESRAKALGIDR
jgi:hypothetical protein